MKTLILGAGGVGGYLAGRMAQRGHMPTLLLREGTAQVVEQNGLHIQSPLGDWTGTVPYLHSEEGNPRGHKTEENSFDLVVLSCKAYDLHSAIDAIAPHVSSETLVLPLLNGVRHIEILRQAIPHARLLGGVAHIGATTNGPGQVKHLNRLCSYFAGPLRGGPEVPEQMQLLLSSIQGNDLDTQLVADASEAMWTKFVFLATLAAVTCLYRADIGTIVAVPGGRDTILMTLNEACAVAEAEGYPPPERDLERYRSQLTEEGSNAAASMLRDLLARRRTESEHILGDIVARGELHGFATPNLATALRHLRAYEIQRTRS